MKRRRRPCFLPDDYLVRKAKKRSNSVCGVLFLIIMFAIGSAFVWSERSLRWVEAEHAAVEKECRLAMAKLGQLKELEQTQISLAHKADVAASLLEKVPRSFLVAEIANAVPAGVSLLDLRVSTGQLRPTVTLSLTGLAQTDIQVSELANKLSRSTVLKDVNVLRSEQFIPESAIKPVMVTLRRFEIDMALDESTKLAAPTPTASTAVELAPD